MSTTSSDLFSLAMDTISKAKESIKISSDGPDEMPSNPKRKTGKKNLKTPKNVPNNHPNSHPNSHPNNHPETMEDIEKRYTKRKKIEDQKDKERSHDISRFQKDMDDISVTIDLNLRKYLSIQTEDLADKFGLVRNNVDENSSKNMKALADRQMREQSMLALRHITSSFTNKKIYDELEGTCSWLDSQHNNHVKNFEKIGVSVSEVAGYRPADVQKEKDLVALLESSEALLTSTSEESSAGSAKKIALLATKLQETQDKWKEESTAMVVSLEKRMVEKAGELRQTIRVLESELSELRRRGSELDQHLSGTKEGQMREEINSEVKAIERRYEFHIERQKKQIAVISSRVESLSKVNDELRQSIETNDIRLQMATSEPASTSNVRYEIEEFMSRCEAQVDKLKSEVETSEVELKNLKGLTDDCRDEVVSLQSQGQKINLEISTCVNRQKSHIKALSNELGELTKKKAEITDETDLIHDRIMALTIAQNRRKQSSVNKRDLNLDDEDGQNFLMKAKLAATDVSQITADRILQKRIDNRFAPGHTRLWPDPNSSDKQDLIHFVEHDLDAFDDDDDDTTTAGDDINYQPSSKSHVCEAAYRHFALKLLSKDGKGKAKGKKSKSQKSAVVNPTCSYKESISVCVAIVTDLLTLKHLDKTFLNSTISELNSFSREIPIMKPEDVELDIYTKFLVPLINHITTYKVNNIVAENKLLTVRVVIVSAFALLGVLYLCLPIAFNQFSFELTPHPGFVKHMEDISSAVLKKLLTSTSMKKIEGDRPTSRSAKQKKTKSGKQKPIKDSVEIDDPLHPRTIYQAAEIAIYQKTHEFKRIGVFNQVNVVREWVGSTTSREFSSHIHKDWQATSSNGNKCRGKTMYSEDRFGLCAYQILIYELSAFGLQKSHDKKYKKLSPSSLANLKECLDNIKRQSCTYTAEFGNIETLLKRVAPCSVPLLMALEFSRKIIDEELSRQAIYAAIAEGTHEDLQYLKSSRSSTAASSRIGTAAREDAFLRGLPADERQYLLDMQMTINLAVDDVLEAFENEGDDDDDYDTVKISDFLKKHITKHMYILDDIVFSPFDVDGLSKVKTEIYKFQKHLKALTLARNKTLDVGGEYTKPLRNKLEKLNNDLADQLEIFYHKCHQKKILEAEIIEMQQETTDLYGANKSVIKGTFSHYQEEVERIAALISNDTESLRARWTKKQQLKDECRVLKDELLSLKSHHKDIKTKLFEMGNALSYTSAEATTQGAHIILALLSDLIEFTESKQVESNGAERANVSELIAMQRHKARASNSEVDTERILRHILSYFSDKDFAVLGAVFLDETISRSMSRGLDDAVALFGEGERARNIIVRKESTKVEGFNLTDEKESKFRNGSGIDPRHVSNRRGHRMSVIAVESFVNDDTLPTTLVTDDAIRKSRESSAKSSRRISVAGFDEIRNNSRPSSQNHRPSSQEVREDGKGLRKPSSAGRTVLPLSRESNRSAGEDIAEKLLEKFTTPLDHPPQTFPKEFKSIVPPGEKLAAFNDSECSSLRSATVSTLTMKTKGSSKTSQSTKNSVPLVNAPQDSSRKATLALLSGGDGRVSSYVAK